MGPERCLLEHDVCNIFPRASWDDLFTSFLRFWSLRGDIGELVGITFRCRASFFFRDCFLSENGVQDRLVMPRVLENWLRARYDLLVAGGFHILRICVSVATFFCCVRVCLLFVCVLCVVCCVLCVVC